MGTLTPKISLKKPTVKVETDWDERWNENADVLDDAVLTANLSGAGEVTVTDDGSGNVVVSGASTTITFGGMVESLDVLIESPSVKTYTLEQSAKYGYVLDDLTHITSSGTVSGTLTINGVDITGINNLTMSISEATATAVGNNVVVAGDSLALVLSGTVDTPTDLALTLQTTRSS